MTVARDPSAPPYLPCPVCKGGTSHHAACSVPVLGLAARPATVWETSPDSGICAACDMPSDWADSCSQGCEPA